MKDQKTNKDLTRIAHYITCAEVDIRDEDYISAAEMLFLCSVATHRFMNREGISWTEIGEPNARGLQFLFNSQGDLYDIEVIRGYNIMHRLYNVLMDREIEKLLCV